MNNNLPHCPLTDCNGGEHHYHETMAHGLAVEECEDSGDGTTRCYSQHRPGLPEPGSLPEITDEMVERATSIFIGSSGYAAPGMRAALTGFRAELLAGGTRWQPIELDEIRAGMRIRATTTFDDYVTTRTGVAHHANKYGDWLTEENRMLAGWYDPTIYEVDSATIPADPDADLIKELARLLDLIDAEDARDVIAAVREHDGKVGLTAIRAHDEEVMGNE